MRKRENDVLLYYSDLHLHECSKATRVRTRIFHLSVVSNRLTEHRSIAVSEYRSHGDKDWQDTDADAVYRFHSLQNKYNVIISKR